MFGSNDSNVLFQRQDNKYIDLAMSQMNYVLGKNPQNLSYMIGFGLKWPEHPRHIIANGYTKTNNDYLKKAKYLLNGAILSGPDKNDSFKDNVEEPKYTSVSIWYNASAFGALAALTTYQTKSARS